MDHQQLIHHFIVIAILTLLLTLSYWAAVNELEDLQDGDFFDSDDER